MSLHLPPGGQKRAGTHSHQPTSSLPDACLQSKANFIQASLTHGEFKSAQRKLFSHQSKLQDKHMQTSFTELSLKHQVWLRRSHHKWEAYQSGCHQDCNVFSHGLRNYPILQATHLLRRGIPAATALLPVHIIFYAMFNGQHRGQLSKHKCSLPSAC